MIDGVLVIDKPSGPTSHDVVARVRRAVHVKRMGHTGTLDPLATGVLPLVVGRATRLARFLSAGAKTYAATIRLGVSTDTYDALGATTEGGKQGEPAGPCPTVDADVIEGVLDRFRGTFDQRPPPYSAKKLDGARAYALARQGRPVAPAPVSVTVERLELLAVAAGQVDVRLTASAGFYVRSLAQDLGAALGCGAHLQALRRERSGDFGLDDAWPLDELERQPAAVTQRVIPMARLSMGMPAAILTDAGRQLAAHGHTIAPCDLVHPAASAAAAGHVRLLDRDGGLIAVAEPGQDALHPRVVLV